MTDPSRKRQKNNSIQVKISILMIAAVILLAATCYLLYRNLSSIVSSIRIDEKPELRLLSIREISMDIEKAGNSVRIYTATKNPSDIRPYYTFISNIDRKISSLRSECNNDSVLLAQTDAIRNLIEENIYIWNQLLVLSRDDIVIGNLRKLSVQLDSVTDSPGNQGIRNRVFSLITDSMQTANERAVDPDDILAQSQLKREEMAIKELRLARNSSEITGKFYDLITKMEDEVYQHMEAKAEAAATVADKTFRWMVMLSISGGLLALLVVYIIIRYARGALSYQSALENSRNEAEKLAKTREIFLANMSHEIRTPLTAISGFTEQLLREHRNTESAGSLKIIKSSSDHLLRIIDDILDFSKLQSGMLRLEKVNFRISQIMDEVCRMFEHQAQKNNSKLGCRLRPGTPVVLFGDPHRLRQIMINLVGNSVKFTKNGIVSFEVSSKDISPGEVELVMEFADTGIGIDESRIRAVFDDFTQEEMSTTRKYGGTGLGLSIVKKLVELHNGTIDLTSRKNKGTTAICRIPYMKGDESLVSPDLEGPAAVPEEIRGMKVLVVDDEEYNRLLFKKIFERWEMNCELAANGMEALEILKERKFDMLFMDMLMPGIDGLKTTRFIRDEMKIKETEMPVICISAAYPSGDASNYRDVGIHAFLQKPFTEEMLLSAILSVKPDQGETAGSDPRINKPESSDSKGKIDLQNLYHIAGGDNDFIRQMLESFISTTGKGLNEMRDYIAQNRWDSVADTAHRIQPPCRHLGVTELYALLNRIEKEIRINNETTEISTLTEKAAGEFEDIIRLVKEHISKMG